VVMAQSGGSSQNQRLFMFLFTKCDEGPCAHKRPRRGTLAHRQAHSYS
jgi:hypothetical protein